MIRIENQTPSINLYYGEKWSLSFCIVFILISFYHLIILLYIFYLRFYSHYFLFRLKIIKIFTQVILYNNKVMVDFSKNTYRYTNFIVKIRFMNLKISVVLDFYLNWKDNRILKKNKSSACFSRGMMTLKWLCKCWTDIKNEKEKKEQKIHEWI